MLRAARIFGRTLPVVACMTADGFQLSHCEWVTSDPATSQLKSQTARAKQRQIYLTNNREGLTITWQPSEVFHQDYYIDWGDRGQLGSGGYGEVFLAVHKKTGVHCNCSDSTLMSESQRGESSLEPAC